MKVCNLSFDIETLCQIPAGKKALKRGVREAELELDISHAVGTILDILAEKSLLATFFVVGEFAKDNKSLIRKIAKNHEIASHSQTHPFLNRCSTEEFRNEVIESKKILEAISAKNVVGFRAPSFNMNEEDYTILKEAGYLYSSSFMPSLKIPFFYGGRRLPEKTAILEFPLSVHPIFKLPLGGAWIRLIGKQFICDGLRKLSESNTDLALYFHPWEFLDLSSKSLPLRVRWRTGKYYQDVFEEVMDFVQKEGYFFNSFEYQTAQKQERLLNRYEGL